LAAEKRKDGAAGDVVIAVGGLVVGEGIPTRMGLVLVLLQRGLGTESSLGPPCT
jgi:hypothetical protein